MTSSIEVHVQVQGIPSDEELAGVIALFSAMATPTRPTPCAAPVWPRRQQLLRRTHLERGWRASALPR